MADAAGVAGTLLAGLALAGLLAAASRRAELSGLVACAFLAAAGLCLGLCLRRGVFAFPAGREMKWWRSSWSSRTTCLTWAWASSRGGPFRQDRRHPLRQGPAAAVPLYAVLAGPPFAALVELFSGRLDDNFTVGIVSSGFLYSLRYFLG